MPRMYRLVVCTALFVALVATDIAKKANEAHAERLVLSNRSVSCGAANRGKLNNGVRLPAKGAGYVIPGHWLKRNYRYGSQQLVSLIKRAARTVARSHPGAILGVSDLSKKNGGTLYNHQSHQSGRDVDLHYYAVDRKNRPFMPDKYMPHYLYNGRAVYARKMGRVPERFFDLARNWAFVKALLTDRSANVTHIFASYQIKSWLLKYAKQKRASRALISRMHKVIMQPSDSGAHNDHMHVRVGCSHTDIRLGHCRRDNWPTSHLRKRRKGKIRLHYWRKCPSKTNS